MTVNKKLTVKNLSELDALISDLANTRKMFEEKIKLFRNHLRGAVVSQAALLTITSELVEHELHKLYMENVGE